MTTDKFAAIERLINYCERVKVASIIIRNARAELAAARERERVLLNDLDKGTQEHLRIVQDYQEREAKYRELLEAANEQLGRPYIIDRLRHSVAACTKMGGSE